MRILEFLIDIGLGSLIVFLVSVLLRRILRQELSSFYKENVMSTIDEVTASVTALNGKITDVSTKLDTISELVSSLEGGQVATQDQVDALAKAVADASDSLDAVSSKEDSIK